VVHAGTRRELARACRVLAHRGLSADVLGHVSVRVGVEQLLVRCRGADERGLLFTEPSDIRLLDFDGNECEAPRDGGRGGYRPPAELPIHTEVLRARPDVDVVVHAHPPSVVAAGLARLLLVPIFGAYDIPAAHLAAGGIAEYGRSVLIRRPELGRELAAALGDRPACVLHGHGVVTVGTSVAQAVLRALQVDTLARTALAVVAAGGKLQPIPDADLAELPDLGTAFNETLLWRHHLARLALDGLDLALEPET
jgi:3,4-dihydroxyphthalate decarboxylase